MKRVYRAKFYLAAAFFLLSGGCAVLPTTSQADLRANGIVGERDQLAQAVKAVEDTPWPRPEPVSLFSRIAGSGGDERVTFSDAVSAYIAALGPAEERMFVLVNDANTNLARATKLNDAALAAVYAPRLSMNDVKLLENGIRTLRENRRVYEAAANELEDSGDAVDPEAIEDISERYGLAIRALGDAADQIAERIENDRSRTYASPERRAVDNLASGI